MSQIPTAVGSDHPEAWNDRHLQHAWIWLTANQNSPYKGAPAMLLHSMGIDRRYWNDFKYSFRVGDFQRYRFEVRRSLTRKLTHILAGQIEPIVIKKDRLGRVIKFSYKTSTDPKPLNCPPFYRGGIRITTKGLFLSLKRTEATVAPLHDPKGRERLINAFGKV